MSDTLLWNQKQTKSINKLYQMIAYSTQINPKSTPLAKEKITKIIRINYNDALLALDEFEKKAPISTYPAFGLSMFLFNNSNND